MDPLPLKSSNNHMDEPPPLEDMSKVLKDMHFYFDQQNEATCCPVFQDMPLKVDKTNEYPKCIRRTKDKTSLVSLQPNDHMLITTSSTKVAGPLSKPLKRGFFGTMPKQRQSLQKLPNTKDVKEEIPLIRSNKPAKDQHNNVPEFMRIAQETSKIKLQNEIRDILKPTQEIVKDVMENNEIKIGLEDPEIMAAVSEIAGNPDAMHKYKHNKKVANFYNQLGKLMGDRFKKQDNNCGRQKDKLSN